MDTDREACLQCGNTTDSPAAEELTSDDIAPQEASDRHGVDVGGGQTMRAIEVRRAVVEELKARYVVTDTPGAAGCAFVAGAIVQCMRVGVGSGELQSVRRSLDQARLEGIV